MSTKCVVLQTGDGSHVIHSCPLSCCRCQWKYCINASIITFNYPVKDQLHVWSLCEKLENWTVNRKCLQASFPVDPASQIQNWIWPLIRAASEVLARLWKDRLSVEKKIIYPLWGCKFNLPFIVNNPLARSPDDATAPFFHNDCSIVCFSIN